LLFFHHFVGTVRFRDVFGHKDRIAMTPAFSARIDLRRAFAVALLAGAAVLAGMARPTAQGIDDIIVTYDQSQLLPLSRPAAEIIIGNPVIADVSVQSGNLLVITGKSFGITNMIALDAKRQVIFERRILVKRDDVRVVNLQRGDKGRQTFNCTPQCNPTVTVGDDKEYFEATMKAAEKKSSMSEKAAEAPGGSQ
jgi:Flp pilus assembly secretin CpaC